MKFSENQSGALRYPLSSILGSKGHVAVLRELVSSAHPLSHSQLLERTNLSRQGVYDITKRLVETGAVKFAGFGKHQLVTMREDYPLYMALVDLFSKEETRYQDFISALHSILSSLEIQPQSAWIFGRAVVSEDEYGESVQIALMGELRTIDSVTGNFRKKIMEERLESRFDVTIEAKGITIADLEAKPFLAYPETIHLWGIAADFYMPSRQDGSTAIKHHKDFDEQSLADSTIWTALLRLYPSIIPRTIAFLEKQIEIVSTGEKMELIEWKNLLESSSFQRLKKLMESDSERAVRLRQSMPFWRVLSDNEQKKFKQLQQESTNI
jgi:hypothetical protein